MRTICLLCAVFVACVARCEATPRSVLVAPYLVAHAASQSFNNWLDIAYPSSDAQPRVPVIRNIPIKVDPAYRRPDNRGTAGQHQVKVVSPDDAEDATVGAMALAGTSAPPRTPPKLSFEDVKVSTEIMNFGLKLMQKIGKSNAVFSPLSLTLCLALLQQGASGVTEGEISRVLNTSPKNSASTFKRFTEAIRNRVSNSTLDVATNLFTSQVYELNNNFKRVALDNFDSSFTRIDFSSPTVAAALIDAWVQKRTRNNIQHLLPPSSIARESQMILVNAVYFKGLWEMKFNKKSTIPGDFYMSNGKSKSTNFMRNIEKYGYKFDGQMQSQVVVIPFQAEQYSLMIILPSQASDLDTVVSGLSGNRLLTYTKLPRQQVKLQIPKFTVRGQTDLKQALQLMGVSSLFGAESELNGIGVYGLTPKIPAAVHSATLTIDEDGGSAAAASAFAGVPLLNDEPVQFNANRPFIGVLWDNALAIPLFMVRIEQP